MELPSKDNRYSGGFKTFRELLSFTYMTTPCQERPQECKPRPIKHVIWDADDTLWDITPYGIASGAEKPFRKIGDEAIEMQGARLEFTKTDGQTIKKVKVPKTLQMRPGITDTLKKLKEMGIESSVASNNSPNSVASILSAMGKLKDFAIVKSSWQSKAEMVKEIATKLKIDPHEVLFVDDSLLNCREVYDELGTLSLCVDMDIKEPQDILKFISQEK